jgi:RNA polymerase sigma factor (sigma-70 family)
MTHDPLRQLIRSIGKLGESACATISDAHLLERFVRSRDEAAFELLVWRHGPMVLGVCRRMLSDAQDAEDAFQTTFLVLVRKAAAIGRAEALGGWLYQVAYRVCIRFGVARARRATREQAGVEALAAPEAEDAGLLEVLDDEINRLPARQRVAFVLCCLEGKTGAEAARLLGCAPGTVSSRLARARDRLRVRLSRRGILVPVASITLGLGAEAIAAPLPATLLAGTVVAGAHLAAGKAAGTALSPQMLSHVEGVLRAMFMTKLRKSAAVVALVGMLAAGGLLAGQALLAQQPGAVDPQDPPAAQAPQAGGAKGDKPDAAGPLTVAVVKPQRGPLPRLSFQQCGVLPSDQVNLHAAVGGVLTSLKVDIGDKVKKGDVLAVIDARLLELEAQAAQSAEREAENLVSEAEAGIQIARADIEVAKYTIKQATADFAAAKACAEEAKQRYVRDQELSSRGGIGAAELGASRATAEKFKEDAASKEAAITVAKAEVMVREAKLARAEAAHRTVRTKVETAHLALLRAREMLSFAKITSPIDGVVTRRSANAGDLVRGVDAASTGSILTVQRTDPVRVVVDIPEGEAAATDVGAEVQLTFHSLPGVAFNGQKIARTGFAIDPQTRTMRVEIDVANPEQKLRPGMSGRATVHLRQGPSNALRVPVSALVTIAPPGVLGGGIPGGAKGGGSGPGGLGPPGGLRPGVGSPGPGGGGEPALYVVRGGKAHRVMVELGQSTDEEIEILAGIRADDLIVIDPTVLQGAAVPVEVKSAPAPR